MSVSIVNGRLIDPAHGIDDTLDLHIDGQLVVAIGDAPAEFAADEVIDARGCVVCPGLVDLAASLREPGYEHKATLATHPHMTAWTTISLPPRRSRPSKPIQRPICHNSAASAPL